MNFEKEFFMKMKLLTLITCTLLFSSAGFASTSGNLPKTPSKEVQRIPVTSRVGGFLNFGGSATGQLQEHPEIHIMYARDQIIRSLQTKLNALQGRIDDLNNSIVAIQSARAARAPIHTISFAELKEIVDEVKAKR